MVKGLVSVIVAAYNHQQYISSLLDSILMQNYDYIEVLVCDDCSKDATYNIIQTYINKFRERGIKLILLRNEKNEGVCKTFNRLLELCEGEFIKPIASDDFLASTKSISTYVSAMEKSLSADVLVANAYMVNCAAEFPLCEETGLKLFYEALPKCDMDQDNVQRMYQENYVCAPSALFRRRVVETVGVYDEDMLFEDWDFYLRVVEAGLNIAFLNECLVAYRQMENSASHGNTEQSYMRQFDGQMRTLVKHAQYVANEGHKERKATLFHYYTIAVENDYRVLAKSVKTAMREQGISLWEWYYSYAKTAIYVRLHRFKERK